MGLIDSAISGAMEAVGSGMMEKVAIRYGEALVR